MDFKVSTNFIMRGILNACKRFERRFLMEVSSSSPDSDTISAQIIFPSMLFFFANTRAARMPSISIRACSTSFGFTLYPPTFIISFFLDKNLKERGFSEIISTQSPVLYHSPDNAMFSDFPARDLCIHNSPSLICRSFFVFSSGVNISP